MQATTKQDINLIHKTRTKHHHNIKPKIQNFSNFSNKNGKKIPDNSPAKTQAAQEHDLTHSPRNPNPKKGPILTQRSTKTSKWGHGQRLLELLESFPLPHLRRTEVSMQTRENNPKTRLLGQS